MAAVKTTEFVAYLVAVAGVLFASSLDRGRSTRTTLPWRFFAFREGRRHRR
jgi:hypothetical protein